MLDWFKKHWLVSLVLGISLVVLGSIGGWLPVDKLARLLVRPVGSVLSNFGQSSGDFLSGITSIGSLSQENQQLRERNNLLQQQLVELEELQAENEQLRAQLEFNAKTQFETAEADIINYQPDSIRQYIRINKGSQAGIKVGDPVLAAGNLLGVVRSVSGKSSDIMLATDADFRVLVKVVGSTAPGIVKGRPPAGLKLERVPQDKDIRPDQLVVTSGLDGQFPPGIVVGRLLDVEADQEAVFKAAQVEPAFILVETELVSVLINLP